VDNFSASYGEKRSFLLTKRFWGLPLSKNRNIGNVQSAERDGLYLDGIFGHKKVRDWQKNMSGRATPTLKVDRANKGWRSKSRWGSKAGPKKGLNGDKKKVKRLIQAKKKNKIKRESKWRSFLNCKFAKIAG